MEIMKLFFTPNEQTLQDKRITGRIRRRGVLNSNFWLYWRTMFAFENWHSALEMKLYIQRFIHHIGGLRISRHCALPKYNQYESMILPVTSYLQELRRAVHFGVSPNVELDVTTSTAASKQASSIVRDDHQPRRMNDRGKRPCVHHKRRLRGELAPSAARKAAKFNTEIKPGGGGRKIAAQDPSFGHPDKFISDAEQTNWESATITTLTLDIPPYIKNICKRDPFTGKVVTGGIVTVKDSSWLLSWTINRQPQFKSDQPKELPACGSMACSPTSPAITSKADARVHRQKGDLHGMAVSHLGVPEDQIEELAETSANTVPCMMPYITAFFMPRAYGDRPGRCAAGAVNFAFLGQFAETTRDTIFTTEYSMRTGMEAVYTLLIVDRGVPEVWGSTCVRA